jgi:hypothetical protein
MSMIIVCGFRFVFCTQFWFDRKRETMITFLLVMVIRFYILAFINYIFFSTSSVFNIRELMCVLI